MGFMALRTMLFQTYGMRPEPVNSMFGEAGFLEGLGQCFARPEFDVAVIPEDGEVAVHLAGEGEEKILEIAVIGRGENDDAAGFQEFVQLRRKPRGS